MSLLLLAAASSAPAAPAENSPVGKWELRYRIGDRPTTVALTITEEAGGGLTGRWRGDLGEETLTDVRFSHGHLTFRRRAKIGRREVDTRFDGAIVGSFLSGGFDTPVGRLSVTGARIGAVGPAPGRAEPKAGPRAGKVPPTREDIRYGGHPRNVLDLWQAPATVDAPLAVYFHGGDFRTGSKEYLDARILGSLLRAGISVASVDYRLLSDAPLPAAFEDARRAIQFLRAGAGSWNLDPKRFGVFGDGAGAELALWLALHDDMADAASADEVARQSSRVACVAAADARTTFDPAWWKASLPGGGEPPDDIDALFGKQPPEVLKKTIADVSALALASAGDPPVYLSYAMRPGEPPPEDPSRRRAWTNHHAIFGVRLKEKLAAAEVEVYLRHPGVFPRFLSATHFLRQKLAP